MANIILKDPPFARYFFGDSRTAFLWFIIRLYVGWVWLTAGIEKVGNPVWTGESAGAALSGFVGGALQKMGGAQPDVQVWYGWFLENVVLPNAATWSHFVAWGELLIGIALIAGIFTGIAAFLGSFMNLNFLLAGTVSINPVLFVLSIGLILSWKVAGYIGLDRWVLPYLGTPWERGRAFR